VTLGLLIALVAHGSASEPGRAQTATEPDTSYMAGETPVPTLALSLEEAQRLATDNSPAGRAAVASLRSARGSMMSEAGVFDPVLFAADWQDNVDSPVSSPFDPSKLRTRSVTGGASWISPIGTGLSLGLERVRFENDAPFSTLPTERRAHARIDFVQPLLKGFGLAATRGELRAAQRELDAAFEALAAANFDVAANVENAYWELFAAEQALNVQRLIRQRAAVFMRDQVRRSQAGVAGPGAVATANTFLAEQEAALLDSRLRAASASDRLGEVMGIHAGSGTYYRTSEAPPPPAPPEPLDVVLARAFAVNPTLRAAEADSAAAHARERQATRNAWPTVEAFGGYGASGLAGVGRQIVFGTDTLGTAFDTGFNEAWDQVSSRDYPEWSFGIRLVVPIGWRSDRGERERQRGIYEATREILRARRLALESDVRRAHRASELGQRELDATLALVASAEEQVRISRLEYQTGRGTAYDLVNIEADLASARLREAVVRVRIAEAAAELRRLTTPAPGRPR
jgi:outer membrane protein TolC